MTNLIVVSFIWAFSFGLIKTQLSGLDSNLVAFIRLMFSLLIFTPFLKRRDIPLPMIGKLIVTGAVQFGLMYTSYIASYKYLDAYQVALFTIFTPVYISLINDLTRKRFHGRYWAAAALAVLGTAVLITREMGFNAALTGIALLQLSNLGFAFGQINYKHLMARLPNLKNTQGMSWLYVGGAAFALVAGLITTSPEVPHISAGQWLTLLYLGVVASGVCFFLWNAGARQVSAGLLAVTNNLKIPAAILVSIFIFGEEVEWIRLIPGLILFAAAWWLGARPMQTEINK